MKSLLISALAFGLTAAPALAAPEHHPNSHRTAVHRETVHRAPAHRQTVHRTVTRRVTPHRTVVTRRTTAHHATTVHRRVTTTARSHPGHFHKAFRAPRRFHAGVWHAPRGFAYRRFAIGERVPAVLLVATFFLDAYASYGLEPPPPGYVWVRDGDDAVLVDRETGEVVEVAYGVFY